MLRHIVDDIAKDAKGFGARIERAIASFETKVGVAETQRGRSRATSHFGLLYAAGIYAKHISILPAEWNCMTACVAGYRNYQEQLPDQTPLLTRLLAIAQRTETLNLRGGTLPKLNDARFERHGAFLKVGVGKRVELLITESLRAQYFEDWRTISRTEEFRRRNERDKDHATIQRQVRRNVDRERFYCFILPPDLIA